MKTCGICALQFKDGVQCGNCKKFLDFGCANIFESGWKKLTDDLRAQWRCHKCKNLTYGPNIITFPEPIEIKEMKQQLQLIPTLVKDIKDIRAELNEVKKTYNPFAYINSITRFVETQMYHTNMYEFNKILATINLLRFELAHTQMKLAHHEQQSRQNNVEIKGITQKPKENLFTILEMICQKIGCTIPKIQINYIARVPSYHSQEKHIIVGFVNRYVKEEFITAAWNTELTTANAGFDGPTRRIKINDCLNKETKALLNKTKIIAKRNNYRYVWVRHTKIHIRKNKASEIFIINKESDLNNII